MDKTPSPVSRQQMLRFAGRVLLLLGLFFGGLWLALRWLPRMALLDYEYAVWVAKVQLAAEPPEGRILLFGDSRAQVGLVPEEIAPRLINLAYAGGTAIEMYYTARRALGREGIPRAVLISLSPWHYGHIDVFWETTATYGLLDAGEFAEVLRLGRATNEPGITGHGVPFHATHYLKAALLPQRFPTFFYPSLLKSGFGQRGAENRRVLEQTRRERGYWPFGAQNGPLRMDQEAGLEGFAVSPLAEHYLEETLELLARRRVPVYLLTMPVSEKSRSAYHAEFVEGFRAHLAKLTELYPNVQLLGPFLPAFPDADFVDPAHLGPKGAQRWSQEVKGMLRREGVLTE